MIEAVPRPRLPHLQHERTRHGRMVWYVRVGKGQRIRLRATFGTKEFKAEYDAAVTGRPVSGNAGEVRFTLAWAIRQYMASPDWLALAGESRKQLGYQYARMADNAGSTPLSRITRKSILVGRDDRAARPSDANKFLRASKKLFAYARDREWIGESPVVDIAKLPTGKSGEGFHTWTAEEMAAYEARWPLGTRQRLAYEIIRCTGLRRGDAWRFGRQHIRNGDYLIRVAKSRKGMVVEGTVPPILWQAIRAVRTGELNLLITAKGKPFGSKQSFGNWFGAACRAAGILGSAHGIRKAVAAEAAEKQATEAQLNSFFGWEHGSRESATYVQKASRAKMSKAVGKLLARTPRPGAGHEIAKPLKTRKD